MPQQQSPFLETKYGWNYGESGWNTGMDENLLKFSFMFDGNVDSIVAALPPVSNGATHFNSVDNRFYFGVGSGNTGRRRAKRRTNEKTCKELEISFN